MTGPIDQQSMERPPFSIQTVVFPYATAPTTHDIDYGPSLRPATEIQSKPFARTINGRA
jgi:hypothetical protein